MIPESHIKGVPSTRVERLSYIKRCSVDVTYAKTYETMKVIDPRGSSTNMYYSTMMKNGILCNLEMLYDEVSNTVYHFRYTRDAIGNLPAISR